MTDLTCPDCLHFADKEVQCEVIEKLPKSYPFGDIIAKCPECGYEWVI